MLIVIDALRCAEPNKVRRVTLVECVRYFSSLVFLCVGVMAQLFFGNIIYYIVGTIGCEEESVAQFNDEPLHG